MKQLSGLRDKLYWRQPSDWSMYHCFKKSRSGKHGHGTEFMALCDAHTMQRSGGQAIRRPPAHMRCGKCDTAEMKRRGWEESGPCTFDPNEDQ